LRCGNWKRGFNDGKLSDKRATCFFVYKSNLYSGMVHSDSNLALYDQYMWYTIIKLYSHTQLLIYYKY